MSSISATRYSTFERCPLQYKFRYIYRLLSQKNDALIIGSLYHEMLQKYHQGDEIGARKIISDDQEHSKILAHLFTKYLGNPILGNVLETEYEFKVYIPGVDIPLYGFIDRIDENQGVEYKTTSKKWSDKDVDTIQTEIYLYALLRKYGRPVPLVYSVNNKKTNVLPQIITVERSEKEILGLEDKIKKYIEEVKVSTYVANPSPACFMCPWSSKSGDGTCIN